MRKNLWFFDRSRNDKGKPLDHKAMQRLSQRMGITGCCPAGLPLGLDRMALRLDRFQHQFLGDVISHLVDIRPMAKAGTFRALRIPVIRAAREPPC